MIGNTTNKMVIATRYRGAHSLVSISSPNRTTTATMTIINSSAAVTIAALPSREVGTARAMNRRNFANIDFVYLDGSRELAIAVCAEDR